MSDRGELRLVVKDEPAAPAPATPGWAVASIAAGAALAAVAVGWAVLRVVRRPRDPYARLLGRLTGAMGVRESDRTRLMMHSGGEARDAVGTLLAAAVYGRGAGRRG